MNKRNTDGRGWDQEIIYHVMPRSFYDSNGDLHGDLNGFRQKLPYLKELGVTTILFTPLYQSDFYHNYFPTNYEKIDPEYGTMDDYITFVKAVHANDMKFLMDMETQYAQNGNIWFDDSYKNPDSEYSDFIYYQDSLNTYPEQIFLESGSDLYDYQAWPEQNLNIVNLDLNNQKVRDWMIDFFTFWLDPDKDGNFDDGVDGFRIDHIMDDLDYRGIFTNLYEEVWKPVFDACKAINPDILIVGEQADWSDFGTEMMEKSGANAAFGFPIRYAIAGTPETFMGSGTETLERDDLNASKIMQSVEKTLEQIPEGKYFINFIENHDLERWATAVNSDKGKLRATAVLNLLLPGIPSIYYGQELGVTGTVGDWGYDVNHIPVREAFPWTPDPDKEGTAVFYKDTGPWWDQSYFNDENIKELALSAQKKDSHSLWNHYKRLIEIRKNHKALMSGEYKSLPQEDANILAFERTLENQRVVVVMNLSGEKESISINEMVPEEYELVYGIDAGALSQGLVLKPYEFSIFKSN